MSKDKKEEGGAKDNRITYQQHGMPCTVEESLLRCIPFKASQRSERPEKRETFSCEHDFFTLKVCKKKVVLKFGLRL